MLLVNMFTWNLVLSLASAQGERKPTPCTGTKVSHEAVDIPAFTHLADWIDLGALKQLTTLKQYSLSIVVVSNCPY